MTQCILLDHPRYGSFYILALNKLHIDSNIIKLRENTCGSELLYR